MKIWTHAVAAGALALALTPVALARFNAPDPSVRERAFSRVVANGAVRVVAEKNLALARLEIPGWLAKEIGDDAGGGGAAASGSIGGPGISSLQTIASGVSLSLAIVLGGLWLRRTKAGSQRHVAGVVLVAAVIAGTSVVTMANLGPAPRYSGNLTKALSPGAELAGPLQIVIMPNATEVRIVVPARGGKED
jgi:hypothetical protein